MARTHAPYKIGFWGPTSSGKTIYLWVYSYLLDTLPALKSREWRLSAQDALTQAQLSLLTAQITNRDSGLPPHTPQETQYRFAIQGYGHFALGRLSAMVTFQDSSGDVVDLPPDDPYYQELKTCDAVLCFLDPKFDPNATRRYGRQTIGGYPNGQMYYYDKLKVLFSVLQKEGESAAEQVMAFIVTKIDDNPDWWRLRLEPDTLLKTVLGDGNTHLIGSHCRRGQCKVFPCSSVGVTPEFGGAYVSNLEQFQNEQGLTQHRIRNLDNFHQRPFGVVEPVTWVLEQLKWRQLRS